MAIEIDTLNQYQYKQYLLLGDEYLKKLEEKQKLDEDAAKSIIRTGVKMRPRTEEQKRKDQAFGRSVKVKYKPPRTYTRKSTDFERNKYHLLDYAEIIKGNLNDKNFVDNNKIIDFLKGDDNAIWETLKTHPISTYAHHLFKDGVWSRSTEMSIEDLIMEAFIGVVIPVVKKGKFKGLSTFFSFSMSCIKYYVMGYYRKHGYTVEYNRKNMYTYKNNRKFVKKY